ncbi:DUF4124 domain-containing protein [Parahaliea mediterranea]|uniref:DUF4124 domain-containing protein n=1 Tax=Parahaliea mediterranea TaxID=651086 RepID=A0A939DES9_9GAMM|nr:DUF4124 domain-containing protein [Parahaliea mediterranea]MBN7796819.1 DUF4124 domain-containing protein [Parahaliea mediterranea]
MTKLMALLLLVASPMAMAEIFRCTDPVTGKTTFTDVACGDNRASRDTIRVQPRNFGGNGHPEPRNQYQRAWRSQDPDRDQPRGPATASNDRALPTAKPGPYPAGGL